MRLFHQVAAHRNVVHLDVAQIELVGRIFRIEHERKVDAGGDALYADDVFLRSVLDVLLRHSQFAVHNHAAVKSTIRFVYLHNLAFKVGYALDVGAPQRFIVAYSVQQEITFVLGQSYAQFIVGILQVLLVAFHQSGSVLGESINNDMLNAAVGFIGGLRGASFAVGTGLNQPHAFGFEHEAHAFAFRADAGSVFPFVLRARGEEQQAGGYPCKMFHLHI